MTKPVIPWIGGKRRLVKHILPLLPDHTTYVEPFAGGAAVLFSKPPSHAEVLNDLNSDLCTLYRVLKHHLEEFVRHFKYCLVSREEFLLAQRIDPTTLTDIQRAARFYYLQRLAFGGKVSGQSFGVSVTTPARLDLTRISEDLSAAHLRLSRVTVEHLPWQECIRRYDRPGTLFYCDPPYWQTEGYGIDFGWEQYEHLARLATTIQGKMLISHHDHPDIRALLKDKIAAEIPLRHTVGGRGGVERVELLIKSW